MHPAHRRIDAANAIDTERLRAQAVDTIVADAEVYTRLAAVVDRVKMDDTSLDTDEYVGQILDALS